jgi:hypothetical protein
VRAGIVAVLALLVATLLGGPALGGPGRGVPGVPAAERELTVMTRNLYLGTELGAIFEAQDAVALQTALATRWLEVQATNFPLRAQALAAEVASHRPHLVGLQEATLWRVGQPAGAPATGTAYDFVDLLLDALSDAGTPYELVTMIDLFDGELPVFPLGVTLRLTDRQAILVRADAMRDGLTLHGASSGVFETNLDLPVPPAGIALEATRGWTAVDVKLRGQPFRFVNTHLEAFHPLVRSAQAAELVAGPLAGAGPTVLVGDINSPAPAGRPEIGDVAYPLLLAQGGLTDAWSVLHPDDPGLTCCFTSDLADPAASLDTRIDVVFFRGPFTPVDAVLVGDDPADRVGGLWPSDHAGVVATLTLPPPGKGVGGR